MAKIGLKYPVYKGAVNYGVIGKVVSTDVSIEMNDAKLYADDSVAESDKSFKKGTITIGVDQATDTVQQELLGHAIASSEMTALATDAAPYVGVGFYALQKVAGVAKFRAIWFPKVQFSEPADANSTKGDGVTFGTSTYVGEIFADASGVWKKEKTFAIEDDAKAYLNALSGLPVIASGGMTGLALVGTGGTLSPAFGTTVRNYAFNALTGASFVLTATAANHIINMYVDGIWSQLLLSGVTSSAVPMSIGTKKITLIAQEVGKQSQTTEIVVVKTA